MTHQNQVMPVFTDSLSGTEQRLLRSSHSFSSDCSHESFLETTRKANRITVRRLLTAAPRKTGIFMVACVVLAYLAPVLQVVEAGIIFDYSYNTVFDSNALDYVVSQSQIRQHNEGGAAAAFWTPSAGYVDAVLVQRFTFPEVASSINLLFNVGTSAGVNTGYALVDGSVDGTTWLTLVERPFGTQPNGLTHYNGLVPQQLTNTTEFWLRVKLRTEGPLADYDPKFAQFSRSLSPDSNPTTPVFRLQASSIPEFNPDGVVGVVALLAGLGGLFERRKPMLRSGS